MASLPRDDQPEFRRRSRYTGELPTQFGLAKKLTKSQLRGEITAGRIASGKSPFTAGVPVVATRARISSERLCTSASPSSLVLANAHHASNAGVPSDSRTVISKSPKLRRRIQGFDELYGEIPSIVRLSPMRSSSRRLVTSRAESNPTRKDALSSRKLIRPTDLIHILSHIQSHPAPLTQTRKALKLSTGVLRHLVKSGLLVERWGPSGVGVTLALSKKGLEHLERIRAASSLPASSRRKIFVPMKYVSYR